MSNTPDPAVIFLIELKENLEPNYTVQKISNEMYRISTNMGGQKRVTNYSLDRQSFEKHSPKVMAIDLANRIKRLFPEPIPERKKDNV